jgi:Lipase (class 3)
MSAVIPYSAKKEDLYFPGRSSNFFLNGLPKSVATLCAEMSRLAYCRREPGFSFDRPRIETFLARAGKWSCQFVESTGNADGRGFHCFVASGADPAGEKLTVVAIRGTDKDDPSDVADDLEIAPVPWQGGGKVHRGFAEALGQIRSDLDRALDKALDMVPGKLLYTGHSLGAAMATLLASIRRPAQLYTFGSPRVGNADFIATLSDLKNSRYVDCCDVVTRMPPEIAGDYRHLGPPFFIDRNQKISFHPTEAAMLEDRVRAEERYLAQYAWQPGNVGLRDLADHAPINYVSALLAAE